MTHILKLHHAAYRCRDSEETRAFYEGFLGLPLAHALTIGETRTGRAARVLHTFFQLADGSSLAFFEEPEVPFDFARPRGFLSALEKRLAERDHSLVVVAEGAGQNLFEDDLGTDASGNEILGDVGVLLKQRIGEYLTRRGVRHSVKE